MKPTEMEEIYNSACRAASNRPIPEPAQLKIWRQTMLGFDAADLRGGLAIWWETEKYLPMPAELKPLAERARGERINRAGAKTYLVLWRCPVCAYTRSGFLTMEDRAVRYCPSHWRPTLPPDAPRVNGERPQRVQLGDGMTCGAELQIIHNDRLVEVYRGAA